MRWQRLAAELVDVDGRCLFGGVRGSALRLVRRNSAVIIAMGCGDAYPVFPGKRYEDRKIDDPAGQSVEAVRPIRDEICTRIEALLADLVPATGRLTLWACERASSRPPRLSDHFYLDLRESS
jgi:hypothetical protein